LNLGKAAGPDTAVTVDPVPGGVSVGNTIADNAQFHQIQADGRAERDHGRRVQARLAEIDRRYSRRRIKSVPYEIRLAEVRRLLRGRLGPEPTKLALDQFIYERIGPRLHDRADVLGCFLELTFEEKVKHRINTIRCIDRDPADVSAFYRKQQQQRQNQRRRHARARARTERQSRQELSARGQDALKLLRTDWQTVGELARRALECFGWAAKLSPQSLPRVLRREYKALAAKQRAQELRRRCSRGNCEWVFRLSAPEPPLTESPVTMPSACPHLNGQQNGRGTGNCETISEGQRTDAQPHMTLHSAAKSVSAEMPDLPDFLRRQPTRGERA